MVTRKKEFLKIKFKFATAVDLNKCLEQIKLHIYKCAPITAFPTKCKCHGKVLLK